MATIDQLIDELDSCPCCGADVLTESRPEDGIPEGDVFEAHFNCGARVSVTTRADYRVATGCPSPLEYKLDDLKERIEAEEPADENEAAS